MPSLAIARDGKRMVSRPLKRTEPLRRSRIPIMALSVVVLPAPLRPSRVATSPSSTSKLTPCSTCDSPYQPWRSRTDSNAAGAMPLAGDAATRVSAMARSDIGLEHPRIFRDLGIFAFGEDLAARQHGDAIGKRRDHRQVVLDHQHGAVLGSSPDQCRNPLHVLG